MSSNKDILLNNQIMFRGKLQYIHNILFDHTKKGTFKTDRGVTRKLKQPNYILKYENIFTTNITFAFVAFANFIKSSM